MSDSSEILPYNNKEMKLLHTLARTIEPLALSVHIRHTGL